MSHRLVNIFFLFSLIFIFVLFCKTGDQIRIGMAFTAALVLSFLAFILNWLTLDGSISAVLFGTIAYGLGGTLGAMIILGFFVSSSVISKDIIIGGDSEHPERRQFRRNGNQVWANGFWFVLFIFSWFITNSELFLYAATASMAAATADTWATEIGGNYKPGTTRLLTSFKKVSPGTDGGVSIKGLVAALLGSSFISFIYLLFTSGTNWKLFFILSLAGFFGSMIDSWMGAIIQGKKFNLPYGTAYKEAEVFVDNDFVNWTGTGAGALMAILLTKIGLI